MKITIKKLQTQEEFNFEVEPSTKIIDIKRNIALNGKQRVSTQKLLYMGRMLLNHETISTYPNIKDGAKIHLLIIKPEGLEAAAARYFKEKGMSDEKANRLGNRLQVVAKETFNKMSWDDIERLALNILGDENIDLTRSLYSEIGDLHNKL
ncbi:unnamed protein product [Pieris macdunnoughi]|uniref:Ubiquitin-like domain-containing protein n=1 Tax=Pieris macdunnoughi TaxID=345717 RepID=A0A821L4F4_9NEOP|nr:unnamed protein product [Pieris macdunnoughi]